MRRFGWKLRVALVAVLVATVCGGAVALAQPASAATNYYAQCTTPVFYWGTRACDTTAVHANPRGHYVDVYLNACHNIKWRIWDVANGVVVGQGVNHDDRSRTAHARITGLYGNYVARIWDTCAHDKLTVSGR
jgi:hypothetical protein